MNHPDDLGILLGGSIFLAIFIVNIFYCWSLFDAMRRLPKEKQLLPAWLCWLILIPIAGIVFNWIMEPFIIPKSFAANFPETDAVVQGKSRSLFGLGLAHVILMTVSIIPVIGFITGIASFIIWIIYWVKVVNFKNEHLLTVSPSNESNQT